MSLLRTEIENLQPSGIARVALPRFTDPSVIPLWIGEGDMVTAEFIREAAKRAIDEGYTFYAHTRGRAELRNALETYLDRIYDMDVNPERISVPGSSMMGITLAAQMTVGHGRRQGQHQGHLHQQPVQSHRLDYSAVHPREPARLLSGAGYRPDRRRGVSPQRLRRRARAVAHDHGPR